MYLVLVYPVLPSEVLWLSALLLRIRAQKLTIDMSPSIERRVRLLLFYVDVVKSSVQEIVRLGIPRLGTRGKQEQGLYEKVIWPPTALRIGLLRRSALQNDGLDAPVILQCRTPQESNPKGHWGPNHFFIQSLFLLPPCTNSWYTQSYELLNSTQVEDFAGWILWPWTRGSNAYEPIWTALNRHPQSSHCDKRG